MNRKLTVLLGSMVISGVVVFSAIDLGEDKHSSVFAKKTDKTNVNSQTKSGDITTLELSSSQSSLSKYRESKNVEEDLRGLKLDISKSRKELEESAEKEIAELDDPDEILEEANDLLAQLQDEGAYIIEPTVNFGSAPISERSRAILDSNEETEARLMEIERRFKNMGNNK